MDKKSDVGGGPPRSDATPGALMRHMAYGFGESVLGGGPEDLTPRWGLSDEPKYSNRSLRSAMASGAVTVDQLVEDFRRGIEAAMRGRGR